MDVLANLKFSNSHAILENFPDFPLNPELGQLSLVNGILYLFVNLGGFTTWYPISNETRYFIHYQGSLSTKWTITHNLDTSNFIFFVYDELNKLISPEYEFIDNNVFCLNFTAAKKGRAVVFVAAERYVPVVSSDSLVLQEDYNTLLRKVKQIELGM